MIRNVYMKYLSYILEFISLFNCLASHKSVTTWFWLHMLPMSYSAQAGQQKKFIGYIVTAKFIVTNTNGMNPAIQHKTLHSSCHSFISS